MGVIKIVNPKVPNLPLAASHSYHEHKFFAHSHQCRFGLLKKAITHRSITIQVQTTNTMEEMAENVRYVPEVQVTYEGDGDIVDEDQMDQLMSDFFYLEDMDSMFQSDEGKVAMDDMHSVTMTVNTFPVENVLSSTNNFLMNQEKKKAKRRRCRPIAIDDPRKFYADNNVAAWCSGDIDRYREVLERQNTPDCIWIQRHTNDTPQHPAYREIRGREKMIEFVAAMMEINPDMVMHLSNRKLHVCGDGSAYLVSKATYDAMTIFPIMFTAMVKRTQKFLSSINPIEALRSYFYGGNLQSVDKSLDGTTLAAEKSAQKSKRRKTSPLDSTFVLPDQLGGASSIGRNSKDSSLSSTSSESNAMVSTPETKIVVVPDMKHIPFRISSTISNVSYINQDGRIYKMESFVKVKVTRLAFASSREMR